MSAFSINLDYWAPMFICTLCSWKVFVRIFSGIFFRKRNEKGGEFGDEGRIICRDDIDLMVSDIQL